MKAYKTLFVIGILIIITPFLGVTAFTKIVLQMVWGGLLILIAVFAKLQKMHIENLITKKESEAHIFSEDLPRETTEISETLENDENHESIIDNGQQEKTN